MLRQWMMAMISGAACLSAPIVHAAYKDTVDLGQLSPDVVSFQFFNSLPADGVPTSQAQYSNSPQTFAMYGGSGPLINGTLTGTPGGLPTLIYDFSSSGPIQISGAVDGPAANFQNVSLYQGSPNGTSTLISSGQFFCGCGPGVGGYSYTNLSGGGGAGNYFIELSDPQFPTWGNPALRQPSVAGDSLFTVKIAPANAPELDPSAAIASILALSSLIAISNGRRRPRTLRG
jgi:hypothetical protein